MWPCCDITSSDDAEHNTDNNFLLLFADIGIMPTLLERLTDIDVLHIALGCRFALDIFTVSQQLSLHLISSHFLTILSSPHSEHGRYTCIKRSRRTTGLDHDHYSFHPQWAYLEMTTTRALIVTSLCRHVRYASLNFVLITSFRHAWLCTHLSRRCIGL